MTLNSIKFLLKLKNSALKQKISCVCLVSFQKIQLCKILYKKGLIQSFFIKEKYIFVQHRFLNSFSPLRTLKLISRPSRIIILSNKIIHRLKVSSSVFFFLTLKGLCTLNECKFLSCGGILLFIC